MLLLAPQAVQRLHARCPYPGADDAVGRHPRQAIAVRRLRCAAEEACRARLAANAAGDEAEEAADEYDAYDAGLGAAEDRADAARERLRVAEREAAWSRAVEVLARLRAARRRSHSVLEEERCVVCVEEHDVVLVVDEEEVFTVPEAPAGVPALQDDDLPPLLYISWCRVTNQVVSRVWVTSQVVAMPLPPRPAAASSLPNRPPRRPL